MVEQGTHLDGSPIRLLHVTEAPGGGVLSYLQEVIGYQSQIEAVSAIGVLGPQMNAAPIREVSGAKVQVESFDHVRGSVTTLLRLALRSRRMVKAACPDILNIHSTFAGVVVRLAALTLPKRPKIIYVPHSWAFSRLSSFRGLTATIERLLSRYTDRIICVSHAEMRDAVKAGIAEERCSVIENGIRILPDAHDPSSSRRQMGVDDKLRVLFVGRFDRQKGFDFFLDVMGWLGADAEGFAVGDYVIGNADSAMTIPDNVTLLGWRQRNEVQELYRNADLLLMPSRWEGLPIVALEAMRARLAVFSTSVGGLQDVVVDQVTGRFINLRDPEGTAAMIKAASRSGLVAFGEAGYQRFLERFTAERMNEEIIRLYRSVIAAQ